MNNTKKQGDKNKISNGGEGGHIFFPIKNEGNEKIIADGGDESRRGKSDSIHINSDENNFVSAKRDKALNPIVKTKMKFFEIWWMKYLVFPLTVGMILAVIGISSIFRLNSDSYDNTGATFNGTVLQGRNNQLIANEYKSIPYSKYFTTNIENLTATLKNLDDLASTGSIHPIEEIYNVKYILPNGKEAFIKKLVRDRRYTLFYTNDDFSDLYIPEEYRINNNNVCWLAEIVCDNGGCSPDIRFKAQIADTDLKRCYKLLP